MRLGRFAPFLPMLLLGLACSGRGERVLRVATRSPVASLDPQVTDDRATLQVLSHIFEPLVVFDGEGRVAPHLATSWTNPTDRTWRFVLRRDVRFHDGRPLTADDVAFTLDRGRSLPNSWLRQTVPLLESAKVLDQHTLELVTTSPAPLLLNQMAAVFILGRAATGAPPLGTGPYRLAQRSEDGSEATLERFAGHWRSTPVWDRAVFKTQTDGRLRLDEVFSGRADIAEAPRIEDLPRLLGNSAFQLIQYTGPLLAVLGFAVERGPFADAHVREAIHLAIDRGALVRDALGGLGQPATQLAPPRIFGYDPDLPLVRQDLEAARSALARSRFPRGFAEGLYFSERDAGLARLVAAQAEAIGIRLELHEVTWAELDRSMSERQAPAYVLQMSFPSFDTSDLLTWAFHSRSPDRRFGMLNFSGYSDTDLDSVIEASERKLNSVERYALLKRAMRSALASRAWIPLCIPSQLYAARKGLRWRGNPRSRIRLDEIGEVER